MLDSATARAGMSAGSGTTVVSQTVRPLGTLAGEHARSTHNRERLPSSLGFEFLERRTHARLRRVEVAARHPDRRVAERVFDIVQGATGFKQLRSELVSQ